MGRKISIVLFWTLIVLCVIALSRMMWQDWRGSLRVGAFVVPFVVFSQWLQNRFAGRRRRVATVMIYSATFAILSGSFVAMDLTFLRSGLGGRSDVVEAVLAGAMFVVCSSVFVWSLCRLLMGGDRIPT
jgi:hypothetical protein